MSRYQGRHRTKAAPAWRNSRVAVPAVAAATLTLTAAGVAQATSNNANQAGASLTLGKPHAATTSFDRVEQQAASRSQSRSNTQVASKVQQALAARAAQQKAAAAKAAADKTAKQRSAALDALSKSSSASALAAAPAPAAASGSASSPSTAAGSTNSTAAASSSSSGSSNDSSDDSSSSGWIFPIAGPHSISSGFGHRASPGGIGSTNHMGDDFPTAIGTPLRAMKSGTITAVGWYGGQGMRVEIDFGGGVSAVYAHMSAFSVSVGERVSQGEVVGYSGNTGNSTGPHLHLEIHLNGVPVNPAPWLSARGLL